MRGRTGALEVAIIAGTHSSTQDESEAGYVTPRELIYRRKVRMRQAVCHLELPSANCQARFGVVDIAI